MRGLHHLASPHSGRQPFCMAISLLQEQISMPIFRHLALMTIGIHLGALRLHTHYQQEGQWARQKCHGPQILFGQQASNKQVCSPLSMPCWTWLSFVCNWCSQSIHTCQISLQHRNSLICTGLQKVFLQSTKEMWMNRAVSDPHVGDQWKLFRTYAPVELPLLFDVWQWHWSFIPAQSAIFHWWQYSLKRFTQLIVLSDMIRIPDHLAPVRTQVPDTVPAHPANMYPDPGAFLQLNCSSTKYTNVLSQSIPCCAWRAISHESVS